MSIPGIQLGSSARGLCSLPEQCFEIAPSMHHAENKNVLTIDTVDDDVLTHAGAARPGAEIFVAGSPNIGEVGQKKETAGDRVNQASGNIHASALFGDVKPDVVKIGFRLWRYPVSH